MLFRSEGHVALDRNPGPGYDTLLLRMIPGDLISAFPHRQFHTLPGLLECCRGHAKVVASKLKSQYKDFKMSYQGHHVTSVLWLVLIEVMSRS